MLFNFSNAIYRNVLINVTRSCNYACDYCYVGSNKENSNNFISIEIVEKIIGDYISNLNSYKPEERFLYFIWHGGEPLLAGINFFKKILNLQKKYTNKNYKILNGVQTNGTLITEKWARFFKKNNIMLGISIDGPVHVQNLHRTTRQHQSLFNQIIYGITLLKNHDVPFSAISVITNKNYRFWKDTIIFFMDLGVDYVDFLPCYDSGGREFLSPKNYESFLINLFNFWIKNGTSNLRIRFFDDLITKISNNVTSKTPIGCELNGRCGEIQYITENGDLYPCVTLPVTKELRLGNMMTDGLQSSLNSQNHKKFKEKFNKLPKECFNCSVFSICRGGCVTRRWFVPKGKTSRGRDYYCQARKKIIYRVKEYLQKEI